MAHLRFSFVLILILISCQNNQSDTNNEITLETLIEKLSLSKSEFTDFALDNDFVFEQIQEYEGSITEYYKSIKPNLTSTGIDYYSKLSWSKKESGKKIITYSFYDKKIFNELKEKLDAKLDYKYKKNNAKLENILFIEYNSTETDKAFTLMTIYDEELVRYSIALGSNFN